MTHVWTCQESSARETWEKSIEGLRQWLKDQETNPDIIRAICKGLMAWRNDTGEIVSTRNVNLQRVLVTQNLLGWQSLLEGRLVKGWRDLQGGHLSAISSRKSSRRWTTALIRKLWQVSWDQWEHRNVFQHGDTDRTANRQVNEQIAREFRLGPRNLPERLQHFFNGDKEEFQGKQLNWKTAWVETIQNERAAFYGECKDGLCSRKDNEWPNLRRKGTSKGLIGRQLPDKRTEDG